MIRTWGKEKAMLQLILKHAQKENFDDLFWFLIGPNSYNLDYNPAMYVLYFLRRPITGIRPN